MTQSSIDPVEMTSELVRCASVTPQDDGALDVLAGYLRDAGFACHFVERGRVRNLFARWGARGHPRSFGFNGHTDVVPIGRESDWSMPPFGAQIRDGVLYGRGATDMKSGVAAFAAAAIDYVKNTPPDGAIILAITGDEEGEAKDGTLALLDDMAASGEQMSVCLVGEPTCPKTMGEMMKIGRRGSLTAWFTVTGTQGHVAYPHRANNPLPALAYLMDKLARHELDNGTDHFDPSTLALVGIDTGNTATNVIPSTASAVLNIRYNDAHSGASLSQWLREQADAVQERYGVQIETQFKNSGESFFTPPGVFSDLIGKSVEAVTGVKPVLSTSGGTSDARFMKDHCPVVEFGLVGQSMHQVDEHVEIAHIYQLKEVYSAILKGYFEISR